MKRGNVLSKYTNFCAKNYLAPLSIKLRVLEACVTSSVTYSSETWANHIPKDLEVLYRCGIKTALAIRQSTQNEIVYAESYLVPLEGTIKQRQLKFWKNLCSSNENTKLSKLIEQAKILNIEYIKYYTDLKEEYHTPQLCLQNITDNFRNKLKEKFVNEEDADSKLGSYRKVNPELENPNTILPNYIFELDRILITRFRTGSHNLAIETGRFRSPPTPRGERLCVCGESIQTVSHVLLECHLLEEIRNHNLNNVEEIFKWNGVCKFLLSASKVLKIEC